MATTATPTRDRLTTAHAEYLTLRARMIAEQEELDWDVYRRYRLPSDAEAASVVGGDPEPLNLGERAFEIVLARRMAARQAETQWFARHGSTPITELPAHWSASCRATMEARIALIEKCRDLALIERPECKRPLVCELWEKQEEQALRGWLLDRLEARHLWFALTTTATSSLCRRPSERRPTSSSPTQTSGPLPHCGPVRRWGGPTPISPRSSAR